MLLAEPDIRRGPLSPLFFNYKAERGQHRDPELLSCFLTQLKTVQHLQKTDLNLKCKTTIKTLSDAQNCLNDCRTHLHNSLQLLLMFPSLVHDEAFDDLWIILQPFLKAFWQEKDKAICAANNKCTKAKECFSSPAVTPPRSPPRVLLCGRKGSISESINYKVILHALTPYSFVHSMMTCQQLLTFDPKVQLNRVDVVVFLMNSDSVRDKQCLHLVSAASYQGISIITVRDSTFILPELTSPHFCDSSSNKHFFNIPHPPHKEGPNLASVIRKQYDDAILFSADHNSSVNTLYRRLSACSLPYTFPNENSDKQLKPPMPPAHGSTLEVVGNSVSRPTSSVEMSSPIAKLEGTDMFRRKFKAITLPKLEVRGGRSASGDRRHKLRRRRSKSALPPLNMKNSLVVGSSDHGVKSSSYTGLEKTVTSPNTFSPPMYEVSAQSDPEEERLSQLNWFNIPDHNTFLVFKKGAKPKLVQWPLKEERRDSILVLMNDDASDFSIPFDVPCPTDLETESLLSSPEPT